MLKFVDTNADYFHNLSVHLNGVDTTALRPDQRALAGIGWVPQERNIFKSLTVQMALSPQCGFSSTVHGNAIAVEAQRAKIGAGRRHREQRLGLCLTRRLRATALSGRGETD